MSATPVPATDRPWPLSRGRIRDDIYPRVTWRREAIGPANVIVAEQGVFVNHINYYRTFCPDRARICNGANPLH